MAVVAGEGYVSEACRVLFASANQSKDYQLFVLHDADPHGYNIARTLQAATWRMPQHNITVTDLGLKLEDALAMGLETEEFSRKKALPQYLELTDLESKYFEGERQGHGKSWLCRRVELNAMTGPQLIEYTERKLQEAGVRGKVIPPPESLSLSAVDDFEGAIASRAAEAVRSLVDMNALEEHLVKKFRKKLPLGEVQAHIEEQLKLHPVRSWRQVLALWVDELLFKHKKKLTAEVEAFVVKHLAEKGEE
jgi:hypothetical protein